MGTVAAVLIIGHECVLICKFKIAVTDVIEISFRYDHKVSPMKEPHLRKGRWGQHFRTE